MQPLPVRPVAVSILLTFVTCGIYGLFWSYYIADDLQNATGRRDISPGVEILLMFVTCGLYSIYFYYKYARLLVDVQAQRGLPQRDNSIICLILAVLGLSIVSMAIIQSDINSLGGF